MQSSFLPVWAVHLFGPLISDPHLHILELKDL